MLNVREGDVAELAVLFERYHAPLTGFFRRLSGDATASEDLTQETFWRILRYRRSFKSGQPFRAWMYQIGRNLFYDHARRRSADPIQFEGEGRDSDQEANEDSVTRIEVERSERAELLHAALQRLTDEKRELIVLCRFEELPHSEIAEVLGCSTGAVKVRLFRALRELKEAYLDLGGERVS